jgi:hypothetical protein
VKRLSRGFAIFQAEERIHTQRHAIGEIVNGRPFEKILRFGADVQCATQI